MDLRKLKTLIDLVSDSNVSELEITEAEGKVRIVKGQPAVVQSAAPAQPLQVAQAAPFTGMRFAGKRPRQFPFQRRHAGHGAGCDQG